MSPTCGPYSNPGVTGATTGPYAGSPVSAVVTQVADQLDELALPTMVHGKWILGQLARKLREAVLPAADEHHPDGGAPIWHTDDGPVTAYPQGIELDGYLHEDIDELERTALAVLAAVQAVRGMRS